MAGEYTLTIFTEVVAERATKELCTVMPSLELWIVKRRSGSIWDPDKKRYYAHIETHHGAIEADR